MALRRHETAAAVLLAAFAVAGCGGGLADADDDTARASASTGVPARVDTLESTFESIYALGEAVLDAIYEGDPARLATYGLNAAEWYWIVWPELPAARPETGLTWEYPWRDLNQKSGNSARRTIANHQGRRYRLLRVEFAGETTAYASFRVHRDARCVVETARGEIVTLDLFGSVIERHGRFKAFSFNVD